MRAKHCSLEEMLLGEVVLELSDGAFDGANVGEFSLNWFQLGRNVGRVVGDAITLEEFDEGGIVTQRNRIGVSQPPIQP